MTISIVDLNLRKVKSSHLYPIRAPYTLYTIVAIDARTRQHQEQTRQHQRRLPSWQSQCCHLPTLLLISPCGWQLLAPATFTTRHCIYCIILALYLNHLERCRIDCPLTIGCNTLLSAGTRPSIPRKKIGTRIYVWTCSFAQYKNYRWLCECLLTFPLHLNHYEL